MNNENTDIIKFSQGEVYLWPEQGSSIMLKAITKSGDPVELEPEEAKELGETLIRLAAKIM
jgi:hypothetical protein